jgi:threonine aldolase
VLTSEAGAPAALAGVTLRTIPGRAAESPIEAWLEQARHVGGPAESNPSLCCFENTHNRFGGSVASAAYCAELAKRLREECRVKLHLDGARVLYAAAATGSAPSALAAPFDTVSISLNKGLGSPIAAALAGGREAITRAENIRQRLGGGIRPVAAGAAATLVALEDFTHLEDDIRRAKRFAALLSTCEYLDFDAWPVVSNLAFFSVRNMSLSGPALVDRCAAEGVLMNASANRLRAVFYRGITDDDVESAVATLKRVLDRAA